MALATSAANLVGYLNGVIQSRGTYSCPHGVIYIISQGEIDPFIAAVAVDLGSNPVTAEPNEPAAGLQ